MKYRTKDGRADYEFSFEQESNGEWRAYIQNQPSYGRRSTDAHSTHRLSSGNRKYVCWNKPLKTLEQAKQIAALWSDASQEYIRSGRRF